MNLLFLLACTKEPVLPGPPAIDEVERVVVVGDNTANNPSFTLSSVGLLAANDDDVFPDWVGKDLATRLPGAEIVRLDRGGDSYAALADDVPPIAGLDAEDARPTLVIVQLGVNDLVAVALRALNDEFLRQDPQPAIDEFRVHVGSVLAATQDPTLFPTPPRVVVTNIPDPSDGTGDLAALVTTFFPFAGAEQVTPELALTIMDGYDAAIQAEADEIGATVVDVRGAFEGHGYHFDEEEHPAYDAEDPTFWYATVIDPNLRGAHEVRREYWEALTGEAIDVIPTDLPVESTIGLPDVPTAGWSNALVGAEITQELVADGTTYTNVAADPEVAVGAPTGASTGSVAMGVLGAWLVLDMGEGELVTDGEGEDLVVLEFGAQSGGTPEPYRVSVGDAPDGPWTVLADGRGERAFDLGISGVAKARYVKLESLAQDVEVLNGLGSPYYPGPEIDAVGAVYPGP